MRPIVFSLVLLFIQNIFADFYDNNQLIQEEQSNTLQGNKFFYNLKNTFINNFPNDKNVLDYTSKDKAHISDENFQKKSIIINSSDNTDYDSEFARSFAVRKNNPAIFEKLVNTDNLSTKSKMKLERVDKKNTVEKVFNKALRRNVIQEAGNKPGNFIFH